MATKENLPELTFITEDDLTGVQEAAKSVEAPVNLENTPANPTVIPPVTEVAEPAAQPPSTELDLSGYTDAAKFALHYQKVNKTLPEDMEIPKEMTWEQLSEAVYSNFTKEKDEEKEARLKQIEEEAEARLKEKGLTDTYLAYIQQLMAGGDPQVIQRTAQYRSWAEAELQTEEEFEAVVRAGLMIRHGNSEDSIKMIDSYIKNELSKPEDLKEAATAQQSYIGKVADALEEQDKQRIQQAEAQRNNAETQYTKDVEKQVKSGFYGLNLSKPEQQELIDYMTKKTEVIDVDTPNGKQRIKVTKEEADRRKDSGDITKRIFEAYQRKVGYDKVTNRLVDVVNTNSTDRFLKSIQQITEPNTILPAQNGADVFELTI